MRRYVKVVGGYVVAEYGDVREWRFVISSEIPHYKDSLIEGKIQEVRTLMKNERFDLIRDERHVSPERDGLRVLIFAKKGKWRTMTKEQITAERP